MRTGALQLRFCMPEQYRYSLILEIFSFSQVIKVAGCWVLVAGCGNKKQATSN
jgi:hypothetical protein